MQPTRFKLISHAAQQHCTSSKTGLLIRSALEADGVLSLPRSALECNKSFITVIRPIFYSFPEVAYRVVSTYGESISQYLQQVERRLVLRWKQSYVAL